MNQPQAENVDFSNISYLISDWDGTIIDSMPAKTESFIKVVNEKFHADPATLRQFYNSTAGMPLSFQIKECVRKFANIQIDNSLPLEEEFYRNLEGSRSIILEGAKDFLKKIKQKGLKVVIWSGTTTKILGKEIFNHSLSQYVDYYIGNVMGSNKLIKGSGLFRIIAEKFVVTEEELAKKSLIIGDGNGDVLVGKQVGARTAAFRLQKSGADFYFENYSELLNKLPIVK